MVFKLTSKDFRVTSKTYSYIQNQLEKMVNGLPDFITETNVVSLLIRKHPSKYQPKRHYHHAYTNFTNRKSALALFEGSVDLKLPIKHLYVQFKGKSIEEGLHVGMKRIEKELNKYKDLHLKSRSKYPDNQTIRRMEVYE